MEGRPNHEAVPDAMEVKIMKRSLLVLILAVVLVLAITVPALAAPPSNAPATGTGFVAATSWAGPYQEAWLALCKGNINIGGNEKVVGVVGHVNDWTSGNDIWFYAQDSGLKLNMGNVRSTEITVNVVGTLNWGSVTILDGATATLTTPAFRGVGDVFPSMYTFPGGFQAFNYKFATVSDWQLVNEGVFNYGYDASNEVWTIESILAKGCFHFGA
jgi:hypothetical protein